MNTVLLGKTGIRSPQNAFGALPIQRVEMDSAKKLLRRAYDGGMTFFDTARSYSNSEEKLAAAFSGMYDKITIASKTMAKTPEAFWTDLETSLRTLNTDHIDIYQFHFAQQCYGPNDGTGMYECMLEAKRQGKIGHIAVTTHLLSVANDCVASGLYESLQFPFSYLSTDSEIELVKSCERANMGFIAMKALAGGLITDSAAAFAFISQFPGVLPIWGIQKEVELEEFLSYMDSNNHQGMTPEIQAFIDKERHELGGSFCRGCGYCLPCPKGIQINWCARMSMLIRRAPAQSQLDKKSQEMMMKAKDCVDCGSCKKKCPYGLEVPKLLRANLEDYERILAGEVSPL